MLNERLGLGDFLVKFISLLIRKNGENDDIKTIYIYSNKLSSGYQRVINVNPSSKYDIFMFNVNEEWNFIVQKSSTKEMFVFNLTNIPMHQFLSLISSRLPILPSIRLISKGRISMLKLFHIPNVSDRSKMQISLLNADFIKILHWLLSNKIEIIYETSIAELRRKIVNTKLDSIFLESFPDEDPHFVKEHKLYQKNREYWEHQDYVFDTGKSEFKIAFLEKLRFFAEYRPKPIFATTFEAIAPEILGNPTSDYCSVRDDLFSLLISNLDVKLILECLPFCFPGKSSVLSNEIFNEFRQTAFKATQFFNKSFQKLNKFQIEFSQIDHFMTKIDFNSSELDFLIGRATRNGISIFLNLKYAALYRNETLPIEMEMDAHDSENEPSDSTVAGLAEISANAPTVQNLDKDKRNQTASTIKVKLEAGEHDSPLKLIAPSMKPLRSNSTSVVSQEQSDTYQSKTTSAQNDNVSSSNTPGRSNIRNAEAEINDTMIQNNQKKDERNMANNTNNLHSRQHSLSKSQAADTDNQRIQSSFQTTDSRRDQIPQSSALSLWRLQVDAARRYKRPPKTAIFPAPEPKPAPKPGLKKGPTHESRQAPTPKIAPELAPEPTSELEPAPKRRKTADDPGMRTSTSQNSFRATVISSFDSTAQSAFINTADAKNHPPIAPGSNVDASTGNNSTFEATTLSRDPKNKGNYRARGPALQDGKIFSSFNKIIQECRADVDQELRDVRMSPEHYLSNAYANVKDNDDFAKFQNLVLDPYFERFQLEFKTYPIETVAQYSHPQLIESVSALKVNALRLTSQINNKVLETIKVQKSMLQEHHAEMQHLRSKIEKSNLVKNLEVKRLNAIIKELEAKKNQIP